jgi:exodeoxyribonuclease V alpha subunit
MVGQCGGGVWSLCLISISMNFLPLMMQYGRMLYKQLIYTALTRAKKRAIFVGQIKALDLAVKNIDNSLRQSSLDMLLTE